jgi:hypothetical protein
MAMEEEMVAARWKTVQMKRVLNVFAFWHISFRCRSLHALL